jgi:hypothetical protein
MRNFMCQMVGYDDEDDWTEIVKALDAEDAATMYAEQCERRSGGDMLNREDQDKETVLVKETADATSVLRFVVTVSYHKHFWASAA